MQADDRKRNPSRTTVDDVVFSITLSIFAASLAVLVASAFTGEPESINVAASALESVSSIRRLRRLNPATLERIHAASFPASASSMAPSACLAKRPRSRAWTGPSLGHGQPPNCVC